MGSSPNVSRDHLLALPASISSMFDFRFEGLCGSDFGSQFIVPPIREPGSLGDDAQQNKERLRLCK